MVMVESAFIAQLKIFPLADFWDIYEEKLEHNTRYLLNFPSVVQRIAERWQTLK